MTGVTIKLALLFVTTLAACATEATTAKNVTGPDGSLNWWELTCRNDIGDCLAQAKEHCPGGYDHNDTVWEDQRGTPRSKVAIGGGVPVSHTGKTKVLSGEMLVRCKDAK